jgi:hypothetical protein
MKKKLAESTFVQSLLSLGVVVVFALIGLGSIDLGLGGYLNVGYGYESQETKVLANGDYQQTMKYEYSYTVRTGKKDKYGRWDGPVKYESYRMPENTLTYSEEYTLVNNRRHGTTTIQKHNGSIVEECYRMGVKVECSKSAQKNTTSVSAFTVLSEKYPWYYRKFEDLDIEKSFTKAFLDTIETLLYKNDFTDGEFENYYGQALDDLDGTVYDTLINLNSWFTYLEGQEALKSSDFRMAVIDSYSSANPDTYSSLQNSYPNYLNLMNSGGISNADFEIFCHDLDSIFQTYEPLVKEDPFFTDSIDTRTGNTLMTILSAEDSTKSAVLYLKGAQVLKKEKTLTGVWQQLSPLFQEVKSDSVSQNVAMFVFLFMFMEYDQADIVKKSVREAWHLKTNTAKPPVVTTELSAYNSSTSATLIGIVFESGGADVTSRGVAWAGFYNPEVTDPTITGGTGTGEFSVTISGLIPGNTYYARAFATNSVGTAYGNCISFSTNALVGTEIKETTKIVFDIFPNPSAGLTTFRFNLESTGNTEIVIVNISGQVVFQKNLGILPQGENQIQLNLSTLEPGIYNCRLTNNRATTGAGKFIIAR